MYWKFLVCLFGCFLYFCFQSSLKNTRIDAPRDRKPCFFQAAGHTLDNIRPDYAILAKARPNLELESPLTGIVNIKLMFTDATLGCPNGTPGVANESKQNRLLCTFYWKLCTETLLRHSDFVTANGGCAISQSCWIVQCGRVGYSIIENYTKQNYYRTMLHLPEKQALQM